MSDKTAKNTFDKDSVVKSKKYKGYAPELKEGTSYTLDDVNKILQNFLKRKDDGK